MNKIGLDALPPVIQLILREADTTDDPLDVVRRIPDLLSELRRQALWSLGEFDYAKVNAPDDGHLTVGLLDGLDPFSSKGKCANPDCRIESALQVGRSVGLYADQVLVPDLLSYDLAFTLEWPTPALFDLITEVLVILTLRPLLEAGLFRFYSPIMKRCNACHDALESKIDELTLSLFEEVGSQVGVEMRGKRMVVDTGDLMGTAMTFSRLLSRKEKQALKSGTKIEVIGREAFKRQLEQHIAATLNTITITSNAGGTTFSDSRVGLMAARHFDGARPAYRDVQAWESARSTTLPWIPDLSMGQILRLREEADTALPRFRVRMARLMGSEQAAQNPQTLVSELREEAAEVETELRALNKPSKDRTRTAQGLVGLAISVYGYAAEALSAGMALGGLMALWQQLHKSHSEVEQQHAQIVSKPGYVLVKAKELLRHSGQSSDR